jgi:hypothetical protein
MLQALSDWMISLHFHGWVGGYEWVWPLCEIIHFVGMALLLGCIGILDLRILGVGKGIPFAPLERFVPLGLLGFLLNMSTGFIFVAGSPELRPIDYFSGNLAFQLKMLGILLAGLNALAFYVLGVSRTLARLGPNDAAPANAKVIAALSLLLWMAVIFCGRLIMYDDALRYSLGLE